jgi:hypothetical protein
MSTLYRCPLCGAARLDECICPTAQTRTSGETVSEKTTTELIEDVILEARTIRIGPNVAEYHKAYDALLSRIRELEADAARLDWVAEHLYASVSHGDDSFTIDWYDEEGYEQHTRMPAFREAIDAARSPESKTEGAKP